MLAVENSSPDDLNDGLLFSECCVFIKDVFIKDKHILPLRLNVFTLYVSSFMQLNQMEFSLQVL